MDPNEIAALAKVASKVATEAYGDLAAAPLKQAGKLGEDIVKTIRLALFPVQFGAALQDRLAGYIDRAVRQVPEPRLIVPIESIVLPVAEKLRFQEADNPITELYINLLSRAMDGERVGEAHPAFVGVISQLAPDEVLFLEQLSKHSYTLVLRMDEGWRTPDQNETENAFNTSDMPTALIERSNRIIFDYKSLNQPEMFYIFLEHLYHLGLVQYVNEPSNNGEYRGYNRKRDYPRFVFIRLSSFGALFYKACVPQPAG